MSVTVLERSRDLLAAGKSKEAVQILRQALTYGGGPPMQLMLGYALYHSGQIGEAKVTLARGVELFPYDANMQEAYARMLWMDGVGEAFANTFIAAVRGRPEDLTLRFKCAEILRQAGDTVRCEQVLREGLKLYPRQPNLLATLGVLLDETGQYDEALQASTAAAEMYPNAMVLQLNRAHTLLRMERAREALAILTDVRAREPGMQQAITYEAMALKQLGDARHDWLCDYERHVQSYDLPAPAGFASIAAFNEELSTFLRGMMDARHHPLEQSLRGGSQTSENLAHIDQALLKTYFAALDEPIRAYIAGLGVDQSHPLWRDAGRGYALSGCWSVLLRPNGFHVNHTHPNGWLSSSYYVSLPDSVNANSQEGWIKFGEPRWAVAGCGVERVVQPVEGRLVLFPSYMWHGTIPFSSGERLTAPFDVVAL